MRHRVIASKRHIVYSSQTVSRTGEKGGFKLFRTCPTVASE